MIIYCWNVLSWNQSVEEFKEIIRLRNEAQNLTLIRDNKDLFKLQYQNNSLCMRIYINPLQFQ